MKLFFALLVAWGGEAVPFESSWSFSEGVNFTLPISSEQGINISWGYNGPAIANTKGPVSYSFPRGDYTIKIDGAFSFNKTFSNFSSNLRVIASWGDFFIDSQTPQYLFANCVNLRLIPHYAPLIIGSADLRGMFCNCSSLTASTLTWNLTGVTSFDYMFAGTGRTISAITLTSPHVTSAIGMFERSQCFGPVFFDTKNVSTMDFMFSQSTFNQTINFSFSSVVSANEMFSYSLFDTLLNLGNASLLRSVSGMFRGAAFNKFIIGNTPSLTDTSYMFKDAVRFNNVVNISTNQVTNMTEMFSGAVLFNKMLNFNTSSVQYFEKMFYNASNFVQNLADWKSAPWTSCSNFCPNCGIPRALATCYPCPAQGSTLKSVKGWDMCTCPIGEHPINTTHCDYYDCSRTGYERRIVNGGEGASNSSCFCKNGYGPEPRYVAGAVIGCDAIPCNNTLGVVGDSPLCVCDTLTGYLGNATWLNTTQVVGCAYVGSFTSIWSTTTTNEAITLPIFSNRCDFSVLWGDDSALQSIQGIDCQHITHNYLTPFRNYTISVIGFVYGFRCNSGSSFLCSQLKEISTWGGFVLTNQSDLAFANCANLEVRAADSPFNNAPNETNVTLRGFFKNVQNLTIVNVSSWTWNLAGVKDVSQMFMQTIFSPLNESFFLDFSVALDVITAKEMFASSNFNSVLKLGTAKVEDMSDMFFNATIFNRPFQFSDTTRVKKMDRMFLQAKSFNLNPGFSTSGVISMNQMFSYASSFNQNVTFLCYSLQDASLMFYGATSFNSTIAFSYVLSLVNLGGFLQDATSYNQPFVSSFDTSRVTNMNNFLRGATSFNQPFLLNVSKVDNMQGMFAKARSFNQYLGTFVKTAYVTDFSEMFRDAESYNQPVSHFDMRNASDIRSMFQGALNFNQECNFTVDVVKLKSASSLFENAKKQNSNVKFVASALVNETAKLSSDFTRMFCDATAFNADVMIDPKLRVFSMKEMFKNCPNFNRLITFALSNNDTSFMFAGAKSFLQDMSSLTGDPFKTMRSCDSFCDLCELPPPSEIRCDACVSELNNTRTLSYLNNSRGKTVCNCGPAEMWMPNSTTPNTCVSQAPTLFPTVGPSQAPSLTPTTLAPTLSPTLLPSAAPTTSPTLASPPSSDARVVTVMFDSRWVTRINASGGVTVSVPPDPVFGPNGTVVIEVKSPSPSTVSQVVAISFYDNELKEKNISNLTNPVVFVIPLLKGAATPIQVCLDEHPGYVVPACNWFDPLDRTWKTEGCTTRLFNTEVECSCSHLTDFAAVTPQANVIPMNQILYLTSENISAYPGGILTVSIVLIVFFTALFISILRDRKERQRENELRVKKLEKWEQARIAMSKRSQKMQIWKQYKDRLQLRHTWASLFFKKTGTTFRAIDRTIVTLSLVLLSMSFSANFHDRDSSFVSRVEVMLLTALGSFLFTIFLTHLFTHTGSLGFYEQYQLEKGFSRPSKFRILRYRFSEKWRYVWYGFVLVSVIGMILYILSIALMFDQNPHYYCLDRTTRAWIIDFIVPYIVSVFLLEPLKIFVFVVSKHAYFQIQRSKIESSTRALDNVEMAEFPEFSDGTDKLASQTA